MRRAALLPLGLAALAGTALHAQDAGDPLLSATISQGVEVDSNYNLDEDSPGTTVFADTRLGIVLLNETQTQVFSLGLDTGLRALWEAEEDFDFTVASPTTARVGYDQDWAGGALESALRYRSTRVDFTNLIFDDATTDVPDDLRRVGGDTTERRFDALLGLDLADDAPSSYALNFQGTRFDYSDDASNRTPRTTLAGDATWELVLTPLLSSAVQVGYYYFDAEEGRETQIREGTVDAGLVYRPSEVLRFALGIGYEDRTRRQLVGDRRETEDESGVAGRLGVNYIFEDVTFDLAARVTTAAPDTRFSGTLRAAYPLPNGRLIARAFQRYGGGSDGDEVRTTGAGLGLVHEINQVSQLEFDVAAAQQENIDSDEPDTDRFDAGATYSYALTEVVSADIGYRFRYRDEDGSANSNAVFVSIGRTFETRP